jgi:hypothetical protein
MKILKIHDLINVGNTKLRSEVQNVMDQIQASIRLMDNPPGTGQFVLYNQRQANGVKPIKDTFVSRLSELGWRHEHRLDIGHTERPGPIDATFPIGPKFFAVEWETGNISSSHRAINKMVMGILNQQLIGGVLILPSRDMYTYLTDRVGNFRELEPYFPVWEQAVYPITEGYLSIIEIEHDDVSNNVPPITKGTDGRALV